MFSKASKRGDIIGVGVDKGGINRSELTNEK